MKHKTFKTLLLVVVYAFWDHHRDHVWDVSGDVGQVGAVVKSASKTYGKALPTSALTWPTTPRSVSGGRPMVVSKTD